MPDLPPIHRINLDRSTERLMCFKERNGHLQNVVRVPAADGSTLDRTAMIALGYIDRDLPYSAGTLGCAVSHPRLFSPAPMKLLHSFSLQGYSISAKGARAALKYCVPLRNRMIRFPRWVPAQ